ncbi:GntR family transcriptional regulator [Rhodococcus triatomae]|uniref:DNA-binding transcriptional regulator, GntR family n=1 Tax=Rhodococcus triatomae TaxID=300028 RepID=A0A1G8BCL7_9NOCA|nr:GntR family transcriptional regulator [Rhodococcus triatomae]QNG17430.1 GntR family transcriptional regulator [Rhodococcus triatomae]QNG22902.1 GntR family transcriptional regulator [Rhodococcus triatomae]SDH30949.1 DNA-binding transcriptional regulator, GntR family [Rhodococcus triatomae]
MPRRPSPLVRHLSTRDLGASQTVILGELRRVILSGDAPPGSSIPVDEVADHFGVSRIPVREALKTLIGEDLVDHRTGGGYTVAQLTIAELEELYLVRGVLESAAHAVAVAQATEADDALAIDAYRALDRSVTEDDPIAYHRESRNFHFALATPCRMHRLLGMFDSAWNVTEPVQSMSKVATPERLQLHRDHRAMLDAFLARDGDRLRVVTERHNAQLDHVIAALPTDTGMFRWTGG